MHVLFFYWYGDHRDLHSFPTRRSSDLPWDGCELWLAELDAGGSPRSPRCIAGGPAESIFQPRWSPEDRKSTRLNSSHVEISYAVFCLKKKKPTRPDTAPHYTIDICGTP